MGNIFTVFLFIETLCVIFSGSVRLHLCAHVNHESSAEKLLAVIKRRIGSILMAVIYTVLVLQLGFEKGRVLRCHMGHLVQTCGHFMPMAYFKKVFF